MSDNKFILQLKGQQTPKSVVEIKNDKLVAPFVNVPNSSDAVGAIIPDKDSSVVVAKGAENWQLDGGALVPATNLTDNGADYTGEYAVSGSGLWVNAVYTFPSTGDPAHPVAEIFNSQTKWVLQLCGKNLLTKNSTTVDFSFIIKIGSSHIMTKTVTVPEQANFFCKRFVLDFSESEQNIIKAQGGANLTVQLLCADGDASATIYNGMTILTALQRRIDASAVSASFANVEEVLRDGLLPNDYFSNGAIIDQVQDGEGGVPIFIRDGDTMNLGRWDEPIPDQAGNAGKVLKTDGDNLVWGDVFQSTDNITIDLNENNELQAIGVINKNTAPAASNPVYDWVGTMAEYTAQDVANQHPDWVCFITNDAYDPQSTYVYDQAIAATVWTINHYLNKYPSIMVVDSAGSTVEYKATIINSNSLQLEFNSPFKGKAYLN